MLKEIFRLSILSAAYHIPNTKCRMCYNIAMKKNYSKWGILFFVLGAAMITYSRLGSASADSITAANTNMAVMGYVFIGGMTLIILAIAILVLFFAGQNK